MQEITYHSVLENNRFTPDLYHECLDSFLGKIKDDASKVRLEIKLIQVFDEA